MVTPEKIMVSWLLDSNVLVIEDVNDNGVAAVVMDVFVSNENLNKCYSFPGQHFFFDYKLI